MVYIQYQCTTQYVSFTYLELLSNSSDNSKYAEKYVSYMLYTYVGLFKLYSKSI